MNISLTTHRTWQGLVAALSLAVLVACGGGGAGGDLGSGGSGITAQGSGTVTGFGSVIVDGVDYVNSGTTGSIERSFGSTTVEAVRLGEQVEVEYGSGDFDESDALRPRYSGAVSGVRIVPGVIGPAANVDAGAGTLTVLGQTIRVNTDPVVGPVTQFGGGITGLAGLADGDPVEVHALLRAGELQATRIEKLASVPAQWRIAGIVANPTSNGTTRSFAIGSLQVSVDASQVQPSGTTLAAGQRVVAFAEPAGYIAATNTLQAVGVRVSTRGERSSTIEDSLGGAIESLVVGTTFRLNGVLVDFTGIPSGEKALVSSGVYVRVRGAFGADGTFVATRLQLRSRESDFEFTGSIVELDTVAKTLTVRDTLIDWSTAALDFTSCLSAGGQLALGMVVEVKGAAGPGGSIQATAIECEDEDPTDGGGSGGGGGGGGGGLELQYRGDTNGLDLSAKTFSLVTRRNGTLQVRWTDSTVFLHDVEPEDLGAGVDIEVDGVLEGGVLIARTIDRHD